ncbi:hypothetical protein [Spiroplasma citri]|uniref:Uncharacterized protein n=1 Tax=Spiroplasma citri TaxID=2133 RepID=A0AAJ4JYC6_SPICI|nr:hypothetical protein [Spiroplasma citri]QIA68983.1 hypothetical protein GL298_05340 [Spiroplasma citri]
MKKVSKEISDQIMEYVINSDFDNLRNITNKSNLEPIITDNDYLEILNTIYELGKKLKEFPNCYRGKKVNTIRDFILLILSLNFKVSVTSESFNRGVKTDIMLKYNNKIFL